MQREIHFERLALRDLCPPTAFQLATVVSDSSRLLAGLGGARKSRIGEAREDGYRGFVGTLEDVYKAGDLLGGKYRVVRPLGEGGMAVVLEAVHERLGHKVALKLLRAALASHQSVVARFEREGRALSKLRNANVVRVFDVDATPAGIPFLVMEYLDGEDLESELRRRGPLPIAEAVHYVLQACTAMQEAHAAGLVHRDLKPTNLFLANEGKTRVVKVLDFGVASDAPAADDARLTRTETVVGTPLYMAPEQFRSARAVDARADVWALGATLYELLTGEAPFVGSAATIGVAIVSDDPRPIRALRPEIPPALWEVIQGTLAKDRERRTPSMTALADALHPFGDGVVIAPRSTAHSRPEIAHVGAAETLLVERPAPPLKPVPSPPSSEHRTATGPAVTQDASTRILPGRGSRRRIVAGLAGVVLVAAVFAAWKMSASPPASAAATGLVTPAILPTAPAPVAADPAPPSLAPASFPSVASAAAAAANPAVAAVDASLAAAPPSLALPPAPHPRSHAPRSGPAPQPASPSAASSGHPLFFPR
jgi:serine/threonine-protein kinase